MGNIEIVENTGSIGQDFDRSYARSYWTWEHGVISCPAQASDAFHHFLEASWDRGKRRTVFRAPMTGDVVGQLCRDESTRNYLEAAIPIPEKTIGENGLYLVTMAQNRPVYSQVENIAQVMFYWTGIRKTDISPAKRVLNHIEQGWIMTNKIENSDLSSLYNLWKPFEWKEEQIRIMQKSITEQSNRGTNKRTLWFAGIRNPESGILISAAMAERLDGDIPIDEERKLIFIEGTEYATDPNFEGQGHASATIAYLHQQVINDVVYGTGRYPLIIAEFDISSRSDIVGGHAGMIVPVDGSIPNTLRDNVVVLDRRNPNGILFHRQLSKAWEQNPNMKKAYKFPFRYLRNFVVGYLPSESIDGLYSESDVINVLHESDKRRERYENNLLSSPSES